MHFSVRQWYEISGFNTLCGTLVNNKCEICIGNPGTYIRVPHGTGLVGRFTANVFQP